MLIFTFSIIINLELFSFHESRTFFGPRSQNSQTQQICLILHSYKWKEVGGLTGVEGGRKSEVGRGKEKRELKVECLSCRNAL